MQLSSYKRLYNTQANKINSKLNAQNLNSNVLMISILGFLLARASIIDSLAPFGIAYCIYMSRYKEYKNISVASVAMGIISSGNIIYTVKYMSILLCVYLITSFVKVKDDDMIKEGIIGFLITTIIAILVSSMKGIYVYDTFMAVFEGIIVFALVYIYSFGMSALTKHKTREIISIEEIISIFIILGFAVTGSTSINAFGLSLKNILTIMLVMIISYKGGASIGAASGITMGLITTMNTIASPIYIGVYGFSGLLAGVFSKVNKYVSVFGYVIGWAIIVTYTRGSAEMITSLREVSLSCILFLMISDTKLDYLSKFLKETANAQDNTLKYVKKMKDIYSSRLLDVESAYNEIAATFDKFAEKEKIIDSTDVAKIMDKINCDVCTDCPMKRSCWTVKFNHTYNLFIDVLGLVEEKGKLTKRNIPSKLEKHCMKSDDMIKSINHQFEIFMINYQWNKKLHQHRKVVSNQIKSLSKGIREVADDMNDDVEFDIKMENDILVELDKENIKVDKVSFLKRRGEKIEINIEKIPCDLGNLCDERIKPIVAKACSKKLVRSSCKSQDEKCIIKLVQSEEFAATTEFASMSKDGSFISGDNHTHMEIKDGKYLVALSDGMGKGKKAARESMMTINILEKMLDAQISEKTTVDTINNMLMLKSSEEMFSTLDVGVIDLKCGNLQSVKMGAVPSYIKRAKGSVEVINSSSLPVGIVDDINIDEDNRHIKEGDFLIMVSDGITDVCKDTNENWLYEFIKKVDNTSPKKMARVILDKALSMVDGEMQDDMTVLVTKVWKGN